jgi:hypothetical protein
MGLDAGCDPGGTAATLQALVHAACGLADVAMGGS